MAGPDNGILSLAAGIRLAIFDVDGVLTDGRLILGPEGEEFKSFHVRDGHGLVMLRDSGVALAIISGRESPAVARRMRELGVEHVYQGCRDKLAVLSSLLDEIGIRKDAHSKVMETALWLTPSCGGCGAVREVCELIMGARNTLDAEFGKYGAAAS
jgi:3-deoxy-D-manno-octulosonate 8-phosphate phosphatase (KDO 8-P phosphatase)